MKSIALVFVLSGAALAAEFLGIVPGATPERLADRYAVIGMTGSGVIVIGDDSRLTDFAALDGRYLAADPKAHSYYRVRLFDPTTREELAEVSRILDFDGEEYLVEIDPARVEELMALRAMLGRVSTRGWVITNVKPELPPVFANPVIEQLVGRVNPDSVLAFVRRLQNYRNRYSTGDSCRAAAQWIAQKLRDYGCDSVYLQQHTTGHAPNVIGIRYGTSGQRDPYAIIDGHFDSYAASNAPGADDNASGTVAAIEACRVTQGFLFSNDLRFIAFSGEEFGLYGSEFYADEARGRGDSILGVLNFDMIGYVDAAPEKLDLVTKIANPPCGPFSTWFAAVADTYTTIACSLQMVSDNQNSDHGPFWDNGYLAFCGIEDFWPGNPHYHTSHDTIGAGYNDNAYCTEVIKAGVAALATLGNPVPLNQPLVGLYRTRIDDAAGNNNGHWDAAESVALYVTLKNFGTVAAHSVSATLSTTDTFVTLFNTNASFGDISGIDTAVGALPFTMRAAANTPREHMAGFTLTITATETSWVNTFALQIGEYLITDPVPDGPRQPPLYWAYDDVDTAYLEHPTFEWVEINSAGTRLSYPQNDDVALVNLPPTFGEFRFYGQSFSQLSVSADGWICPGNYLTRNYSNRPLPDPSTPPGVICANWDDLYPDYNSTGYVYYLYDSANHRFIVEYDSVAYYNPRSTRDKFQAIIYDSAVRTPSGDNVIVLQYRTANGFTSSTVGIEDPTRLIAIQDLYNGALAHGAAPIAAGRAIKFTTVTPTGVADMAASALVPGAPHVRLSTNPVQGIARVRFSLLRTGRVRLAVFDRMGRRVADLLSSDHLLAGAHDVDWNAATLAPGIYFLRLTTDDGTSTGKAVVTR